MVVILSRILKFFGFWKCLGVDGWTTWCRANCKKCESRPRDGKICSAVKTWLASLLFQRKIERWSDCSSRKQGIARWRTMDHTVLKDNIQWWTEGQYIEQRGLQAWKRLWSTVMLLRVLIGSLQTYSAAKRFAIRVGYSIESYPPQLNIATPSKRGVVWVLFARKETSLEQIARWRITLFHRVGNGQGSTCKMEKRTTSPCIFHSLPHPLGFMANAQIMRYLTAI